MKRELALAYARRVQHLMTDPRSLAALDVAERYATATPDEIALARYDAQNVGDTIEEHYSSAYYAGDVAFAVLLPNEHHALLAVTESALQAVAYAAREGCTAVEDAARAARDAESAAQQELLNAS